MQLHPLFALLVLAIVTPAHATVLPYGTYPIRGTYKGVLPCADCAGIWTEIILSDPGPDAGQGSGIFVMSQRFTGGKNGRKTPQTKGTWITWHSDGRDGQTGTLELVPTHSDGTDGTPMFFYVQSGRTLQMLDAQKQSLPLVPYHTLNRVVPQPIEAFGPLTEKDDGATIQVRVGDVVDIRIDTNALSSAAYKPSELGLPSPTVQLVQSYGMGDGNHFYHFWSLRMMSPGQQTLRFPVHEENPASGSQQLKTFTFDVAP